MTVRMPRKEWTSTLISISQSNERQNISLQRFWAIHAASWSAGSKTKCVMAKCDSASTNNATPLMRIPYQAHVSTRLPWGLERPRVMGEMVAI